MAERSDQLTHFDAAGAAHMVDVAGKPATRRVIDAPDTQLLSFGPSTAGTITRLANALYR